MPDYTKQLEEIARALSRPALPEWVKVLLTSIISFASALLLQVGLQRLHKHSEQRRIRRVLYSDLAELFSAVEEIMEFRGIEEPRRWEWQKEQLRLHAVFRGEKYLRENVDVYMQLPEHIVADNVYTYFHRALDDLEHWWHVNWSLARQTFARAVYEDRLKREDFRKFIGEQRAERLYKQCKAIHEESQRALEAMGADGKTQ